MSTKTVLIVVIIAAAAFGGGAATVMLMNGQWDSHLDVDYVQDYVKVGDYWEFETDLTVAMGMTMPDTSESQLKYEIYQKQGVKDTQVQEITYKDLVIYCDVYRYHDAMTDTDHVYYVDPDSGVTYKIVTAKGDDTSFRELTDSNIDLSLTEGSLTFKNGDYVRYTAYEDTGLGKMDGTIEYKVTNYNSTENEMDLEYTADGVIQDGYKMTVADIDWINDVVTLDGVGATTTVSGFLSYVSYDRLVDALKEEKYEVTYGEPEKKVIDTVYGKRDVKVQEIISKNPNSTNASKRTVTYGSEGVIYSMEIEGTSDGISISGTLTLKSSNLVYRR